MGGGGGGGGGTCTGGVQTLEGYRHAVELEQEEWNYSAIPMPFNSMQSRHATGFPFMWFVYFLSH